MPELAMAGEIDADERFLLAGLASGDLAAFRALLDKHLPAVERLARRILGNEADAADVAQEAMLRLWQSGGGIEVGAGGLRPWLNRVTVNLCIDRTRSAKRLVVMDEVPDTPVAADQERVLSEQDLGRRVAAALETLPERQRLALTLFHYEGFTQASIAALMELSEDAVESLIARARRSLKQRLQGEWRQLLEVPP